MKNKNITLISSEAMDSKITPDNTYSWMEVLDNVRLASLDPRLRDLYLRFYHEQLEQASKLRELEADEINLFELLKEYLQNNREHTKTYVYDVDKFSLLPANKVGGLPFFRNTENKNIIGQGLNIISIPLHLCSCHTALMLPYIVNCIKDLESPILMCNTGYLYGYNGTSVYKITDDFHKYLRMTCSDLGILYCEYTGNIANLKKKST